jgi:chorismate mutase
LVVLPIKSIDAPLSSAALRECCMPDDADVHPDLVALRHDLDELDAELVRLLTRRAIVIGRVIAFKEQHHIAVVDRQREDEMMVRIDALARDAGLEPIVARQVLRAIIDNFTLLEFDALGHDGSDSAG